MTIHGLIRKFDRLEPDTLGTGAVDASSEAMEKAVAAQMFDGKNQRGEPIGKYKSKAYAVRKHAMNPKPGYGTPDLKLTGAMHRGIYVDAKGGVIRTESTVPYAKHNEARYGSEIYRLGGKYKVDYVKTHLRPAFMQQITKATGLKPKI